MSFLDTAYRLGADAALHDFRVKHAVGIPQPVQGPNMGAGTTPLPTGGQQPTPMPAGDTTAKLSQDFFGPFLERGDDNPTDAPRKTAAEYAVEKALEKLGEPKSKRNKLRPTSHAPAGKGTRFSALKGKLSRQKGRSRSMTAKG